MRQRVKRQNGYIFKKGKSWFLRYSDSILRDGKVVRVQLCKKLADCGGPYRYAENVRSLADEILLPINAGSQDVRSTMPVAKFIEGVYLPEVKKSRRPSTYKNYRDYIFLRHLKSRLGDISLREFRCCDGERLLADIERQAKPPLSKNTLTRIKSFLSGGFKAAKRLGAFDGVNPMVDTSVGGTAARVTHAYTLAEIRAMLTVLEEPTKTIVLLSAYTGLRQGEMRGLLWKDFTGKELRVERSIWNGIVGKVKTSNSAGVIPIVQPLQAALETHRKSLGVFADPELPIFQSSIHTPTNLANVAKRIIAPTIERCVRCRKSKAEHRPDSHIFELDKSLRWKGWHAFRRGLATTLHQLGTPDREIQAILRHSNIAVTQKSYIKSIVESQVNALDRVAAEMANESNCNQTATRMQRLVN